MEVFKAVQEDNSIGYGICNTYKGTDCFGFPLKKEELQNQLDGLLTIHQNEILVETKKPKEFVAQICEILGGVGIENKRWKYNRKYDYEKNFTGYVCIPTHARLSVPRKLWIHTRQESLIEKFKSFINSMARKRITHTNKKTYIISLKTDEKSD